MTDTTILLMFGGFFLFMIFIYKFASLGVSGTPGKV